MSFQDNCPRVYLFDLQTGATRLVGAFGETTIGPRFSPDGNALLMSVTRNGGAAIVRVNLDGGGMVPLTDSASINVTPCYSPDGSQIVFNSDRDGDQQLFVMSANGGPAKRISYGPGQYAEPAWSPTGDLIAYTFWGQGGFGIGVMQPDGSGERVLPLPGRRRDLLPEWKGADVLPPDELVSGHTSRLVAIGVDGFNERVVDTPTYATDPSWGPLLS